MAIAFTKIRDKCIALKSWGEIRVILIKKDSEASDNTTYFSYDFPYTQYWKTFSYTGSRKNLVIHARK